ncbi:LysM peptidoglycan-binding domain-containing protein [Chryseobacterium oryctis]|uniref:LysM peptidoglycan-binding domain-containing protein n=1 Tax=Chryseobacterium oryctis TaxID=2952618 RepID=A0ABT3HNY8_9FLAO|nr:LysM domain-containing protein [Chryseobacterium oryctis]MCW3161410.1 LysM peptidoglycan-binding domain-containing protein [Chryseobacterium oryctis]
MNLVKYEIQKSDTLESIANKHNVSVEELVDFHNQNSGMTNVIIGDTLPIHLKFVIVSKELVKKQKKKKIKDGEKPSFDKKARYRCEQVNTTKINGDLVQFVEQKFQYLLKIDTVDGLGYVNREDYLKKITPPVMLNVLDFIEETDKIKHNILFTLDENGKLEKILNRKQLNENWKKYKKEKLNSNPFIIELNKTNEKAVQEIVNLGDTQFSSNADNEEEYRKDFFYFICLNQYIVKDDIKTEEFKYLSTIVPPNIVPLILRYDKITEENQLLTVRMVAEYDLSQQLEKEIINQYNNLHRPTIGFSYTQYKLIFRATIEIDTETKLVKKASIKLRESIADNIENECSYNIKQLENYTPDEGI